MGQAPQAGGSKANWPDVRRGPRGRPWRSAQSRGRGARHGQRRVAAPLPGAHRAASCSTAPDARRDDGGLEFHDLLVLARDLVRDDADRPRGAARSLPPPPARRVPGHRSAADRARRAHRHRRSPPPAASPGGSRAVRAGRLFFVGDPKQSIYRFRRADIELFLDARDRFGADAGSPRLTTNFRTVEPILEWVNAFFGAPHGRRGARPAAGLRAAPRASPGRFGRRSPPAAARRRRTPIRRSAPTRSESSKPHDVAAHDRRRTARRTAWPVQDPQRTRPGGGHARLSDIAILLPGPHVAAVSARGPRRRRHRLPACHRHPRLRHPGSARRPGRAPSRGRPERRASAWWRRCDRRSTPAPTSICTATGGPAAAGICAWPPPTTTARRASGPRGAPSPRALWERRWWLDPFGDAGDGRFASATPFLLGFGRARPADVWRRLALSRRPGPRLRRGRRWWPPCLRRMGGAAGRRRRPGARADVARDRRGQRAHHDHPRRQGPRVPHHHAHRHVHPGRSASPRA